MDKDKKCEFLSVRGRVNVYLSAATSRATIVHIDAPAYQCTCGLFCSLSA